MVERDGKSFQKEVDHALVQRDKELQSEIDKRRSFESRLDELEKSLVEKDQKINDLTSYNDSLR